MVVLSLIEGEYTLEDNIGNESILKEHKEFYLMKPLSLLEIENLYKGIISPFVEEKIYESIIHYINKYFDRYLLSLTNIKKIYLRDLDQFTHSKICIGVSDDGDITGIPLKEYQVSSLKTELVKKVYDYYDNIMGLQLKSDKGGIEITIDGTTYYDFNKLVHILKKHTKINIHRVTNTKKYNKACSELRSKIQDLQDESIKYKKGLEEYKRLMAVKIEYNNKYSVPFNQLIRAESIMKEFSSYTSLSEKELYNILSVLKERIIKRYDVEKYLLNGLYINNTLFPDDKEKDKYYAELVKTFLEEYKYFKIIQLRKNINIPRFTMKDPLKKINPLLNNVHIFNQYLDMDFYMIEIEIPFIKDINAYVASKKTKKILERDCNDNDPYTLIKST
tara:strand:- start:61 stop:1230 length:1170 start_codon:yes stop_codon:yes gene_type:complete